MALPNRRSRFFILEWPVLTLWWKCCYPCWWPVLLVFSAWLFPSFLRCNVNPFMSYIGVRFSLTMPLLLIVSQSNFSLYLGSIFLGAGLCMGVCGLSAGICIGILTDAGIRAYAQQPKLFTILIIMLIFAEVLTIYGFIISILLIFRGSSQQCWSVRSFFVSSSFWIGFMPWF